MANFEHALFDDHLVTQIAAIIENPQNHLQNQLELTFSGFIFKNTMRSVSSFQFFFH